MAKKIQLPVLRPRYYQVPLWVGFEAGYRYIMMLCHRRYGKDLSVLNMIACDVMKKKQSVLYFLPSRKLAEDIIWTGSTNEGMRYLAMFPKEIIAHKDNRNMRLTFINGSTIQFMGTDYCENVGMNANLVIFSEFFISKFEAFEVVSPIIRMNKGRIIWLGTVRNKNNAFGLLEAIKGKDDCLVIDHDVRDTGIVTKEDIQFDINSGIITYEKALREYYNVVLDEDEQASSYKETMELMRLENRIGNYPRLHTQQLFCMFDLGVDDLTTIVFFHYVNGKVRIIEYMEDQGKSIEYYAKMLKNTYPSLRKLYLPWDGNQRGKVSAETPRQIFEKFNFRVETVARDSSVLEGVQRTKSYLRKIEIDSKCLALITSLERYTIIKTTKNRVWSHGADNIRGITRLMKDGRLKNEITQMSGSDDRSQLQAWLDFTDTGDTEGSNWIYNDLDRGCL